MAIDPLKVRELRNSLSLERHAQLRIVDEMASAVIAAAGQVRDVRLDQLENPEIAKPDILFDLLNELAFSLAAPKLTKLLAGAIAERLMGPRRMKNVHGLARVQSRDQSRALPAGIRRQERAVADARADDKQRLELLTELTNGLVDFAASKTPDTAKAFAKAPQRPLEIQDSPASFVEEAVLRACARSRQAIGIVFDSYAFDLDEPDTLSEEDRTELSGFLAGLSRCRMLSTEDARRLRLFYESCIWSLAFPTISEPGQRVLVPGDETVSTTFEPTNRLTISSQLALYLVRRLPDSRGDGLQSYADYALAKPKQYDGLPWQDRDGKSLETSLVVFDSTFSALTADFAQIQKDRIALERRLGESVPHVYRLSLLFDQATRFLGLR